MLLAWVSTTILLTAITLPRFFQNAVYSSAQPASVSYHSYDPYLLTVKENGLNWNTLPISRRYQLFIGRASDVSHTYGYRLDYSFHSQSTAEHTAISRLHVAWNATGVTLIEESGQRVFIPQVLFTGGR